MHWSQLYMEHCFRLFLSSKTVISHVDIFIHVHIQIVNDSGLVDVRPAKNKSRSSSC